MSVLMMVKQDYVTGMETCEFQYDWTIKNFHQLIGDETITSPSFSSYYSDFNDKWVLKITSNFSHDYDYEAFTNPIFILADLQLQSFNNTSQLQTICKISINNEGEMTKECNFSEFPETITWDDYTTTWPNQTLYSRNNDFKICCTIIMSKKQTNSSDEISIFDAKQQLSENLQELLLNEKSADVTIKVGQKSFHAIKGILAVRSPVFSAMFDHEEFKENKKNEVVIEDIEEDVFEEFLHYIYTDESPNVKKMPMELLAVAEKYQVDCLKNICERVICKMINLDNVASILVFSDKYNLEKLYKKCLEFIKENLQAVLSNETFQVYKKKHLEVFVSVLEELLSSAKSVNYS